MSARLFMRCIVAAGLASAAACAGDATRDDINEPVSCSTCRIVVEELLTIGDTLSDSGLPGRPLGVRVDGRGRYWISVLDAFPQVYDPATHELRPVGRSGEGPGEFRFPRVMAMLPGDSVLIADVSAFVVLDPDVAIGRRIRGDANVDALTVVEWPGAVLVTTSPFDRVARTTRSILAFHDLSGDAVAAADTLLATEPNSGAGVEWANGFRRVAEPGPAGELWVSQYNHYRLLRYSRSGEVLDSVVRRPAWFPGGEAIRLGGPNESTTPHTLGSWIDERGRLWTFSSRPRSDTRDAWRNTAMADGRMTEVRMASLPPQYKLNDTVIEVIDLSTKDVIARHVFDGYVIGILPGRRIASFVESDLGVPIVRIHRVTLTGHD